MLTLKFTNFLSPPLNASLPILGSLTHMDSKWAELEIPVLTGAGPLSHLGQCTGSSLGHRVEGRDVYVLLSMSERN